MLNNLFYKQHIYQHLFYYIYLLLFDITIYLYKTNLFCLYIIIYFFKNHIH